MDKIKKIIDFLGNVVAVIYFFTAMMIVLFLLGGGPFMLISNIDVIRESGFANPNSGQAIMGLSGLFIEYPCLYLLYEKCIINCRGCFRLPRYYLLMYLS